MKKLLIVFVACLSFVFTSCTKEETKCWEYTLTSVSTTTDNNVVIPAMTMTNTSTVSECGITETEAKAKAKAMSTTLTQENGTLKTTIKVTVTYKAQEKTEKV